MPEITIQIGDNPGVLGYEDNDIVQAENDTQLLWRNTQIVTDHRALPGGFFKPTNSLAYRRLRAFSKWMFERISATEIRRTLLSDMTSEILSNTPNAKEERIDLPLYMARRMAAGKRAMFGDEANAVWFEGTRQVTLDRLTTFWSNYVTPRTGLLAADHRQRNRSDRELSRYLVIVTNDFSNARASAMTEPHYDNTDPDNPVMLAKRRRNIDWRNLPSMEGADITRILDKRQRYSVRRDRVRTETDIVRVRT